MKKTSIPVGWEMKTLGEVSETIMGQAPPGKECNREGLGYPFVKTGQFGGIYPKINEWTTKPLKKVCEGDVLITVVGATIGKLNLGVSCAIGRSVAGIRVKERQFPIDGRLCNLLLLLAMGITPYHSACLHFF